MFVASMNFEEIRNEFEKDKKALLGKLVSHSEAVLKVMRKTNMRTFNKYYEYVSPRKNRWVYHFQSSDGKKEHFQIGVYNYYYTHRSYAVIMYSVEKDILFYYTSHFFMRFLEREGLEKLGMHEIIKLFADKNPRTASQPLKQLSENVYQVFGQMSTGVALGYQHTHLRIYEYRTFITNSMLKGDQIELSQQLEEKFKFHVVRHGPEQA